MHIRMHIHMYAGTHICLWMCVCLHGNVFRISCCFRELSSAVMAKVGHSFVISSIAIIYTYLKAAGHMPHFAAGNKIAVQISTFIESVIRKLFSRKQSFSLYYLISYNWPIMKTCL